MITWDESKRRLNLKKHGIDFLDADSVFDGPTVTAEDTRLAYGEQRLVTLGMLNGIVVSMTYTERQVIYGSFRSERLSNMKRASTSRKSQSNWSRVRALKDKDIVVDRDAPKWTPEMFARSIVRKGLQRATPKSLLSLRVDADVLSWFKSQGPGYQSRMNALLRAFMEAHKT